MPEVLLASYWYGKRRVNVYGMKEPEAPAGQYVFYSAVYTKDDNCLNGGDPLEVMPSYRRVWRMLYRHVNRKRKSKRRVNGYTEAVEVQRSDAQPAEDIVDGTRDEQSGEQQDSDWQGRRDPRPFRDVAVGRLAGRSARLDGLAGSTAAAPTATAAAPTATDRRGKRGRDVGSEGKA